MTEDLDEGVFSAHDVASLLKTYFAELPEPILQERYYPAYCQVLGESGKNPGVAVSNSEA